MSNRLEKATSRVLEFSDENRLNIVMGAPVTFVTGKGGVGKTTISSLISQEALAHGERVLFISLFRDKKTDELLGVTSEDENVDIFKSKTLGCDVSIITPSQALSRYLSGKHMNAITNRLKKTGIFDMIANIVPGMRELLVISDIRAKAQSGKWDRIIVDSPSTGHALSLFNVSESTKSLSSTGVIKQQSQAAIDFLRDGNAVQVVVVTLDHVMPLSECREFVFELEDSLHMNIAGIVINKLHSSNVKKSKGIDKNFSDIFLPLYYYGNENTTNRGFLGLKKHHKLSSSISREVTLMENTKTAIIIGTGGVGKTTTAAAIALAYSRKGKNVALLTVDPARRLGTALGLDDVQTNQSHLDPNDLSVVTEEQSNFHIFQLDAQREFDRLIQETMSSEEYEKMSNNSFVNAVSKMGIVSEYMAIEAMHRLVSSNKYDLVVVDTPPAHHVYDFLDTPGALERMSQSQVYKTLVGASALASITTSVTLGALLRPLKGLIGADLIQDAISFLRSLKDVESVFIDHSQVVAKELTQERTHYFAVSNPSETSLDQVFTLIREMNHRNFSRCDVIVNGVNPTDDFSYIENLNTKLKRFDCSVAILDEIELDNPVDIVEELSKKVI